MKTCLKTLIAAVFILCFGNVFSQNIEMRNFDWPGAAVLQIINERESTEPVVILESRKVLEYTYNKNSELELYSFYYQKVKINESKSVEDYNKIYIPVRSPDQLIVFKARAIASNGKSNEMLRGEMKPVTEDGQLYMSLAIDGVDKGSEVEYFYIIRRSLGFEGAEYIQTNLYTRENDLKIISPENLVYVAKVYNNTSEISDTTINKKRILHMHFSNVPAVFEELYSNEQASRIRVEYKLQKNLSQGKGNLLMYADGGKYYYGQLSAIDKVETKDVEKAFAKLKTDGMDDEDKIRTIEAFLKTNFNVQDDPDIKSLSDVLRKNIADNFSINKLAIMMTKLAKVKFEIVLSISRYKKYFDPDFESWNYLDQVLIYYPGLEMYMMPTSDVNRLGDPPIQFIGCQGLFIREVGLGDMVSVVSSVKKIADLKPATHYDNMDVSIRFSADMKKVEQHVTRSMAGHSNIGVRPYYYFMTPEKRLELAESVMKTGIDDAKVSNIKVSNFNFNSKEANKEFQLIADVTYGSLIEKADNTYLFKVGAVIGPQTQMYQEKPREKPIEIDFPHNLDRVIKITIPEGYSVQGLDALDRKIVGGDAAQPSMGFISTHKVVGNVLEIRINEFYNQLNYPFEQYELFRSIINASADFNKVTIVFEKKV
ncbi:MAG: DUF3857 domain-containing protein [Bacteroidetes bacterium]|nr:MAG: DUF3857 domain-containing protein [Bacteroidota bacterium]